MLANISLQFPEEKILAKLGHVLYKLNIFGYSFIYVPADCMELTMRSQRRNICYFIQILGVKPFPDVILIPTIVNSCMTHLIPKTRMLPICPQIQFCLPKWHYRHLLLAISVRLWRGPPVSYSFVENDVKFALCGIQWYSYQMHWSSYFPLSIRPKHMLN